MNYCKITKSILADESVTDYDLAIYCCLSALTYCSTMNNIILTDSIQLFMNNKSAYSARKITASIENLANLNHITITNISSGSYLLEPNTKTESFLLVPIEDIYRILSGDYKKPAAALRVYITFLSTRDYRAEIGGKKNVVGYMPVSYIASLSRLSKSTIMKYSAELERNELLFICRTDETNCYGRFEDKELILEYAKNSHIYVYNATAANRKRSLMQKYNAIRSGKEYPPEEYAEVAEYIRQYNANLRRKQEMFPDDDYLSLLREELV